MYAWYQRNRRRALAVAAATVAGATAAYYVYSWYTTPPEVTDEASTSGRPAAAATASPKVLSPSGDPVKRDKQADAVVSAPADMTAQLKAHMASLQSIADVQTMPEMRNRLLARLQELSGVARIRSDLQAIRAAPPEPDATARKVTLWLELRDRSLWLLAAATWLLPALTLLVHIQVTVLGRHMYLEQMVRNSDGGASEGGLLRRGSGTAADRKPPPRLWPLSPAQQEAFMSYSAFVLHDGLTTLVPILMPLVQAHAQEHALTDSMSVQEIWQMLSAVHASIDGGMAPSQWAGVLLPPIHVCQALSPKAHGAASPAASPAASSAASPDALPSAFAVHRAAAAADSARAQRAAQEATAAEVLQAAGGCAFPAHFEPTGLGPVEASVVAELVLEARQVLHSEAFASTFRAAVKHCAACAADNVAQHIATAVRSQSVADPSNVKVSVAHAVPALAQVPSELISEGSPVCSGMLALPEVKAFLLDVYARGPFVSDSPVSD